MMHFNRIEEILLDDSFYQWYLQTDESEVLRWNDWRLQNDRNRILLEEAVLALHSLLNQKDEAGFPRRIHAVYSRLERARLETGGPSEEERIADNRAFIPDQGFLDIHLS